MTCPIHDHSCDLTVLRVLLIARQECRNARSEMLVPSMGGDEQGMAVLVVERQDRQTEMTPKRPISPRGMSTSL